MKGIHRILIIYGIILVASCLYTTVFGYYILQNQMMKPTVGASKTTISGTNVHYRLAVRTGQVVILKNGHVFETTGIDENNMTEELKTEVEQGTNFDSAQEVYSFLESYSS